MGFSCSDVVLIISSFPYLIPPGGVTRQREREGLPSVSNSNSPYSSALHLIYYSSGRHTTPHSRLGSIYVSGHLSINTLVWVWALWYRDRISPSRVADISSGPRVIARGARRGRDIWVEKLDGWASEVWAEGMREKEHTRGNGGIGYISSKFPLGTSPISHTCQLI